MRLTPTPELSFRNAGKARRYSAHLPHSESKTAISLDLNAPRIDSFGRSIAPPTKSQSRGSKQRAIQQSPHSIATPTGLELQTDETG